MKLPLVLAGAILAAPAQPEPVALDGVVSWYCLPGRSVCTKDHDDAGLYAAAGPAVRRALGGDWRGQHVVVTVGDRSVEVELVDWCQCHKGEPGRERLLDLYAGAFRQLGALQRGLLRAEVAW